MTEIRKKALCLGLVSALLCGLLCGCGHKELYERLLIHGIGVDRVGETYTVTVRSSVSTKDEGEEYFRVQGATVPEALGKLSLSTGREPFYAHNYLVVFGRSCAEQGLDSCLDFFVRYYGTRPAVQLYLAEGRAEEILSAKEDGKLLKMSQLQRLGESGPLNGKALKIELLDFVNGMEREGSSPVLPVLRAGEQGVGIVSSAYFDGCRLKGFLTLEETRGFLAVKEGKSAGDLVVEDGEGGTVTLTLSRCRREPRAEPERVGAPGFSVTVRTEADVSEASGGKERLEDGTYRALEREAARKLREAAVSALEKAVIGDRCDIFGFGDLLYRSCPGYWKEHGENWKDLMAACSYQVRVEIKVSERWV